MSLKTISAAVISAAVISAAVIKLSGSHAAPAVAGTLHPDVPLIGVATGGEIVAEILRERTENSTLAATGMNSFPNAAVLGVEILLVSLVIAAGLSLDE